MKYEHCMFVFVIQLNYALAAYAQTELFDFATVFPGPYTGGIAVSETGTIFVGQDGVIRRLSRTPAGWNSEVLVGKEGATGSVDGTNNEARLGIPLGLTLAPDGTLFLTDDQTVRQLKYYATNWVLTTICGVHGIRGSTDGTNNAITFSGPQGLAVDPAGAVYVADFENFTIRKLTPVGTNWVSSTIAGLANNSGLDDGTNTDARFTGPLRVAVDRGGNLYVTDHMDIPNSSGRSYIRVVEPLGSNWVTSTLTFDLSNGPIDVAEGVRGIAVGPQGQLYEASEFSCTIAEIAAWGSNLVQTVLAGSVHDPATVDGSNYVGRFYFPREITLDGAGDIFVLDSLDNIRIGTRLPAPPPVLSSITRTGASVALSWVATLGCQYQLEYSSDLDRWTSVGSSITATNQALSVTDAASTRERGFYRLILLR